MAATQRLARAIGVAQCGFGLLLVGAPARVAAAAGGRGARPSPTVVALLGARTAAQGGALLYRPTSRTGGLGAAIDLAHGASMVGLAAISGTYRRPALISASVAAASAAAEVIGTRGLRR